MNGHETQYRILISSTARRDMRKLERQDAKRVDRCISGLAGAPRGQGVVKLTNNDELYRARAGSYRVLFRIDDGDHTIAIAKVRHRREAY